MSAVTAESSRPPARKSRELEARIASGVALAAITLLIIWIGGWLYIAAVAVMTLLATHEWLSLVNGRRLHGVMSVATALLALCGAKAALLPAEIASACLLLSGLAFFLFAVAAGVRRPAMSALGMLYVGGAAAALIYLREQPNSGLAVILFLMFCVWATDTGGYVVGRFVGGYRLWPAVSPAKTWAGLFGGVSAAAIVGASVAVFFASPNVAMAALVAIGLAFAAVAGDLFESKLKRLYNAKDSGSLIPGHGGMLDRIDGLLAATLVFAGIAGLFRAEVFP